MTVLPPSTVTDSSALLTDHYELTMVQAALRSGVADRRAVFEVFARSLPPGRRYGVVAGTGRLLEELERFRFDPAAVDFLAAAGVVDQATCEWLAGYRFAGSVDGYPEGEAFFPGSPVLVVEGGFAEAVVLETLVLSVLNHDSAVASAAARMICAAGERPCIEMGSRRTHEQAAVAAARAAYLVGFASTSNLAAGRCYGIPTAGTSSHAFTLVHDDEPAAFQAQVAGLGAGTTLLVDTFDVEAGIRAAVRVAGPSLGAVRLDSGDLVAGAHRARRLLDELGATRTRIIVTSDLDEHSIAALAAAPVDGYGVGTSVVTGSGAPTAGFVYKLVARAVGDGQLRPVAKASVGKASTGGRKWAGRELGPTGVAVAEVVHVGSEPPDPRSDQRPLLVPLMRAGVPLRRPSVAEGRRHWTQVRVELPAAAWELTPGEPVLPTTFRSGGS